MAKSLAPAEAGVLTPPYQSNLDAYNILQHLLCGPSAARGLGRRLADQLASFDYRGVLVTLLFFLGLTLLVDLGSAVLRRRLR